jgi:hypothetical protein
MLEILSKKKNFLFSKIKFIYTKYKNKYIDESEKLLNLNA